FSKDAWEPSRSHHHRSAAGSRSIELIVDHIEGRFDFAVRSVLMGRPLSCRAPPPSPTAQRTRNPSHITPGHHRQPWATTDRGRLRPRTGGVAVLGLGLSVAPAHCDETAAAEA